MNWLMEDPTPIVAGGLLLVVLWIVALVQTGQARFLGAIAATLVVAGALLGLQWWIETPTEQVDRTLHTIAALLVDDDLVGVLGFLTDDFARREQVRGALAQFRVTQVKLAGQEITVRGQGPGATGTAKFFAHVRGRPRSGGGEEALVRRFQVELRQRDGRWQISSFEDQDVMK